MNVRNCMLNLSVQIYSQDFLLILCSCACFFLIDHVFTDSTGRSREVFLLSLLLVICMLVGIF